MKHWEVADPALTPEENMGWLPLGTDYWREL